jgi:hypothetical protein
VTLELSQIAPQVKAMGQNMANQAQTKSEILQQAKELLQTYSTAFGQLEERVAQAEKIQEGVRFSWLGAAPAGEPLAEYHTPPAAPAKVTVMASDGSQIHPDRHGLALYYLINIGAIVYRHGSGAPPDTLTEPQLYYKDEDLFNQQGLLFPASVINVKRDLAEVDILARLAPAYQHPDTPLVALLDGQLTLRTIDLPAQQQEYYQRNYLLSLNQLQENKALIAAYIDRPRSSFVLALLHLATLKTTEISEETLRQNPFLGLTDAQLFSDLQPGQRTAIFNQRAKANIAYAKEGHQIHFFYLNTGSVESPNLARVEIPGWLAKEPAKLNTLHATLLKQAATTGGYPYVLARAHELAIITPAEREALETMLAVSLRRHGLSAEVSLKQASKNSLGRKEAFKL